MTEIKSFREFIGEGTYIVSGTTKQSKYTGGGQKPADEDKYHREKITSDAQLLKNHRHLVDNEFIHKHIKEYTDSSHVLNKRLLGQHKNLPILFRLSAMLGGRKLDNTSENLSKTLNDHRNSLENKTTVYSGTDSGNFIGHLGKTKNGDVIHFPAFTSTSIDHFVAHRFARGKSDKFQHNHVLVFHLPKGYKKGLYVSPVSKYSEEREFILDKNQKFKKVQTRIRENTKTIYHHLIPHGD